MIAHGHHAVGLGHAVKTSSSHAAFVLVGDVFCHITQGNFLPLPFKASEALLAGEELLHEGLLNVWRLPLNAYLAVAIDLCTRPIVATAAPHFPAPDGPGRPPTANTLLSDTPEA